MRDDRLLNCSNRKDVRIQAIDADDPYGNNPYSVPLPLDTTGDPKWEKQQPAEDQPGWLDPAPKIR